MTVQVPSPWTRSRPLPPYRGLLAVDAKDFTGLPAVQHASVSQLIPELVDQALAEAQLDGVRTAKRFPANTGDGVVFGFDPVHLPYVVWPFLNQLDALLARYNVTSVGPRIRLRVSVHVGPLPDDGQDGDGNGTPRNDTHRLLDSRPVKAVLASSSEEITHLAAIISDRVYEDVVAAGYPGLHPDRCIEVPATVEGKLFAQRAWLYIPSPSGSLLRAGVFPEESVPAEAPEPAADPAASTRPSTHYSGNSQSVREGVAVMGGVTGGLTYTGATHNTGTNQHWGSGDNVSGDKHVGTQEPRR